MLKWCWYAQVILRYCIFLVAVMYDAGDLNLKWFQSITSSLTYWTKLLWAFSCDTKVELMPAMLKNSLGVIKNLTNYHFSVTFSLWLFCKKSGLSFQHNINIWLVIATFFSSSDVIIYIFIQTRKIFKVSFYLSPLIPELSILMTQFYRVAQKLWRHRCGTLRHHY